MKKLDLVKSAESVWNEGVNFEGILSKVTLKAFQHYTEEMNKELYNLRGLYDNPLATKQHLDKLLKDNNEGLRKHGLQKPLQLVLGLEEVQNEVDSLGI